MSDVLVQVERLSKKYCRGLKRSLWYGVRDIVSELKGSDGTLGEVLRPGEFHAVHDVSFELRRGECLGLIGPNGAGKSTLLKLLNGLIKPDSGSIHLRGRMGALIELGAGFHPLLTGRENIYVNGAILGMPKREITRRLDEIIDFAGIEDAIDTPVRTYSSGMRVRLGFAVAAHLEPDVLLIDEVLAVGDIRFRLKCYNQIRNAIERGISCVFVSHDTNALSRICTRGVVIHGGRLTQSSSLAEAITKYESLSAGKAVEDGMHGNEVRDSSVLTVREVEVLNCVGEPQTTFPSLSTIVFRVNYASTVTLQNVTVQARFGSMRLGDLGSFTNEVLEHRIPIQSGEGSFTFKLVDVPLLAGLYYMRLGIFNEARDQLFFNTENACNFSIDSPMPDPWQEFFTLRLKHEWGE